MILKSDLWSLKKKCAGQTDIIEVTQMWYNALEMQKEQLSRNCFRGKHMSPSSIYLKFCLNFNLSRPIAKLFDLNPFLFILFLVTLYLTKITEKDHYLVKRKLF